jgi:HAMP domain-containing protein
MILVSQNGSEVASSGRLKRADKATISKLGWNEAQDGKSWSGLVELPKGVFLAATAPFMDGEPGEQYAKGAAICYAPIDDATLRILGKQLSVEIAFVKGGKVIASSSPMKPFKVGINDSRIITQVQGQDYVGAAFPLGEAGSDAAIVTFRNANDIIGPSKLFLLMFFAVVALGVLLAAVLSEAFTGSLVRPLEAVMLAAVRVGRGEYPEPFNVERKDEIGVLQNAFNRMTASVQEHERKLRAMIDIDPLTELANHRRFKEQLSSELDKGTPLSIVVLDVDNFSDYNRMKGLADGDAVLKACGALLGEIVPDGGLVARYGG